MLRDHRGVVVTAASQMDDEVGAGESVRIDRLQRPMHGDGGRLAVLVPIAKLLPPELLRKYLFSAAKALGNFRLRSRQHLVITEAVHIAHLQTIDEHPVKAGEIISALLERRAVGLLEIVCHRAREMYGVLLP